AEPLHVGYFRVARLDDFPVTFDQGLGLLEERIEAADEVVAAAVATVELHFAPRAGKGEGLRAFRILVTGGKGRSERSRGLLYGQRGRGRLRLRGLRGKGSNGGLPLVLGPPRPRPGRSEQARDGERQGPSYRGFHLCTHPKLGHRFSPLHRLEQALLASAIEPSRGLPLQIDRSRTRPLSQ